MAVELATGYVSLTVSARGIQQQIARELAPVGALAGQAGTKAGETLGNNLSTGIATRLRASGGRIAEAGQSLTLGLSAPLAGIGFLAFKAATDFETAFAGVKKTVDGTAPQLERIRQGIIDMANSIPASREEIAAVAEAAGQLGVQTGSILEFTRVMIDLGNTTNLSADQAASAIARLANITGLPQTQFDNLGATIVELGNKSAATESEIVEMGLRIAGAGTQIGLSEADILGFGAALSSVGIEAEAGGTAISRVFVSLDQATKNGGAQLEAFAKVAGTSAEAFKESFETDAAGASVAFITGLKRISDEGGNVFGVLDELGLADIRVRDALLRASGAGELFADTLKTGNQAFRDNSALTEEAGKRYETTASQLEAAKNQATDVARQFGEALAPAVISAAAAAGPLVGALKFLVDGFKALPAPLQTGAVAMAALAAAAGPVAFFAGNIMRGISGLASGFSAVSSGAGTAAGAVKSFFAAGGGKDTVGLKFLQIREAAAKVGPALKTAATAVTSFAAGSAKAAIAIAKQTAAFVAQKVAMLAASVATKVAAAAQVLLNVAMSANPIGLIVVAIAALVAGFIYAYNNIGPFRDAVDGLFSIIKGIAEWIIANWPIVLIVLLGPFGLLLTVVIKNFGTIRDTIVSVVTTIINFVRANWPILFAILTGGISLAVAFIINHWETIKAVVAFGIAFVRAVITTVVSAIVAFWQFQWNLLVTIVSGVWGFISSAVSAGLNFVRSIFEAFTGGFTAAWNGFWNGLVAVVSRIAGPIGSAFEAVVGVIRRIWNQIARFWNDINIEIPSVDLGPLGEIGGGSFNPPNLPLLAAGAIIKARPGGTQAIIGERAADEAVIPLPKLKDLIALVGGETGGRQGPAVLIENLHAWNGEQAATAIGDVQDWRDKTTGKV